MRALLILIASLACMDMVAAQTRARQSNKGLCEKDEVVVFSCTVGAKIASLCASTDLSATAGRLFYRFGTSKKIELVHPADDRDPRAAFSYSLLPRGDTVRFTRDGAAFSIYSENVPGRGDQDGVLVEKKGAKPVDLRCRKGGLGDFGWSPVYKANLPKSEEPLNRR